MAERSRINEDVEGEMMKKTPKVVLTFFSLMSIGFGQQVAVTRIEQMPNRPTPYLMRNWKHVALGYDSLVFDLNRNGPYLPLVRINTNTINYPSHTSFGLHTVVGTNVPASAEGINCLPAVIGGNLAGVDKSNQNGTNWVLMCEEWFNKKNGQNLYLNHPSASTGVDWWYETMPNVFFCQLYSLYPGVGDFQNQFSTVADRWLAAVKAMGGNATPWSVPTMNHRAWNFSTMSPNDNGVREPEAAGAVAWILYSAYVKTGNRNYRIGAEQAMEFLNEFSMNPSYELQMSYGTSIAARMNAELGTTYDLPKLVQWCFDVGPLRNWGAILGKWGQYDCSGLIGEVNGLNDYAFFMNTAEQIGALMPMVRYDDRFARAMGKWVLNAANALRLFYPKYLPDGNQDSFQWSQQYDPNSYIAHEGMRQFKGAIGPFATGDAISGGWGATNLALYASSHVGILAGIIDTTNVPGILRLDVLKTDYFRDKAYPSYLYFNPDSVQNSLEIDVGSGQHDVYDQVTNAFIARGATGKTSITIPPNAAILAVITPAAGTITYDLDKMLINGVVADYRSGRLVSNYPPRIKSLMPDSSKILRGKSVNIYCTAVDRDKDTLSYSWSASRGTINGSGSSITWTAPDSIGTFLVLCRVVDGRGGEASDTVAIQVVQSINRAPIIKKMSAVPRKIDLRATTVLTCVATDPDGDPLSYNWTSSVGGISGSAARVTWTAPGVEGNYYGVCVVDDGQGGRVKDSIGLEVRDFSRMQTGKLIAFYPFEGNANDASGSGHNGTVNGAVLVADRFGRPGNAYSFDGVGSSIRVPNDSSLNVQRAITVNFWIKIGAFFDREQYPLSHGNWQNRWKVSISNKRLRWTVRTTGGIKDLDSESQLVTDSLYNVTVLYNGSDIELYLNGALDAFSSWSGLILPTTLDLTIGQALPDDNTYNFKGVLDDIRLYDYALSVPQILNLYDIVTSIERPSLASIPDRVMLEQNFPNPFNAFTTIRFSIPHDGVVTLRVFDVLGRIIATLLHGPMFPGTHTVSWNAGDLTSGIYYYRLQTDVGSEAGKMILIK